MLRYSQDNGERMVATIQQQLAYEQSAATRLPSSLCLLSAFGKLGIPKSMIDLGCGPGHLVQIADSLGVWAEGYDISLPEEEVHMPGQSTLYRADITDESDMEVVALRPAELVLCWEVMEHLDPYFAEPVCDVLAEITEGTLLFSAAVPGQGGSGHINEQPNKYWIDLLTERGFVYVWPVTEALRGEWLQLAPSAYWYGRNLLVMRKER